MESSYPAKERHVLTRDSQVPAPHSPIAEQRRQHRNHRADRNGKAKPLPSRDDGGIDAHNRAVARHEWPAGVPRIERRIGLNDLIDEPAGTRSQRSTERADHARRHGVMKSVRIADRNYELPGAERARLAERDRREIRGGNA